VSDNEGVKVTYHEQTDLLYISFDDGPQQMVNREVSEDIILDIGDNCTGSAGSGEVVFSRT